MTSARVMMPFRPCQLFAFIFRRGGLAAICWAVFLCFATALAQSIPEGYVASQEGDVIVIRPPVTAEHEVAIRVFPPIEDSNAAAAVLRRWAASHPLAGVDAKAVTVRSETLGVKTEVPALRRIWKQDMRERQELLLMPQVGAGHYRPMVVHAVSIISGAGMIRERARVAFRPEVGTAELIVAEDLVLQAPSQLVPASVMALYQTLFIGRGRQRRPAFTSSRDS